jgi:hypothetical protein
VAEWRWDAEAAAESLAGGITQPYFISGSSCDGGTYGGGDWLLADSRLADWSERIKRRTCKGKGSKTRGNAPDSKIADMAILALTRPLRSGFLAISLYMEENHGQESSRTQSESAWG